MLMMRFTLQILFLCSIVSWLRHCEVVQGDGRGLRERNGTLDPDLRIDDDHINFIPQRLENTFIVGLNLKANKERKLIWKQVQLAVYKFKKAMKSNGIQFSIVREKGVYAMGHSKLGTSPFTGMNIPRSGIKVEFRSKGVLVGIVDQGIQYTDPAFIVPGKEYFVNPGNPAYFYRMGSRPGYKETQGIYGKHGMAVAAIVGGTDPIAPGVAQQCEFNDYRVLNHLMVGKTSIVLLAIDMAVRDNVDVLCLSLGIDGGFFPIQAGPIFKSNGMDEILFSVANGNRGQSEWLFSLSNFADSSINVAVGSARSAFRIDYQLHVFKGLLSNISAWTVPFKFLTPSYAGLERRIVHFFDGAVVVTSSEYDQQRIYFIGSDPNLNLLQSWLFLFCANSADCQDQFKKFQEQWQLQPKGVIFVCDRWIEPQHFSDARHPIGQALDSQAHAKHILLVGDVSHYSLSQTSVFTGAHEPDTASSMGPSTRGLLKPDISAPGGHLLVYHGIENPRRIETGSSFANGWVAATMAIHVAYQRSNGIPITSAGFVTLAQNSARPMLYTNKFSEYAYPAMKQGAGILNVQGMMYARVSIFPSKLDQIIIVEDHPVDAFYSTLSIFNHGNVNILYQLKHISAVALTYNGATGTFDQRAANAEITYRMEQHLVYPVHDKVIMQAIPFRTTLQVVFSIKTGEIPYTWMSGYIQFMPVALINGEYRPIPEEKAGYGVLHVPYLLHYGNPLMLPNVILYGAKAAFLTDPGIEPYLRNYLELDPPPFSKRYTHTASQLLPFSIKSQLGPVIVLCFVFPAEKIDFYVFDNLFPNVPLGWIGSWKYLRSDCQVFFLYPEPIDSNTILPVTAERLKTKGWNGAYTRMGSSQGLKSVYVGPGIFKICAEIYKRLPQHYFETRTVFNFDYCTAPFIFNE